jgi:hypothetical protein
MVTKSVNMKGLSKLFCTHDTGMLYMMVKGEKPAISVIAIIVLGTILLAI